MRGNDGDEDRGRRDAQDGFDASAADEDPEDDEGPWTEIIRAKRAMDGAATLHEAAELLRQHANWL